jgi:hypothetical protein
LPLLGDPMRTFCLLLASAFVLPGCFYGENESEMVFTLSSENYTFFGGLLYPTELEEGWSQTFDARQRHCPDENDIDDCDADDREDSSVIQYAIPYDTSRVRGLLTQKNDLQITAHLNIGDVYKALEESGYDEWDHFTDEDEGWGRDGDGCGSNFGPYERTGIGPCLLENVQNNVASYKRLDEDLRLVILINLPSEDDVRSTVCQDAPRDFESADWTYPRTSKINYNARVPAESGFDPDEKTGYYDDEDTRPLQGCEIETYARIKLGNEIFSADYYGEDELELPEDEHELLVDRNNDDGETLLGTVELESLVLPGEGDARAVGRYNIAFTASRFGELSGAVTISGTFDAEIQTDVQEIDEPERELDLESAE